MKYVRILRYHCDLLPRHLMSIMGTPRIHHLFFFIDSTSWQDVENFTFGQYLDLSHSKAFLKEILSESKQNLTMIVFKFQKNYWNICTTVSFPGHNFCFPKLDKGVNHPKRWSLYCQRSLMMCNPPQPYLFLPYHLFSGFS